MRLPDRRLDLSISAGPYLYFDTTQAQDAGGYRDEHGWGTLWSARAAWHLDRRWIAQMQLNHAQVFAGHGTTALLLGLGYELDARHEPDQRSQPISRSTAITNNEVTVLLGETVQNGYRSGSTHTAQSIEYRRGLWPCVDLSAFYIHESDHGQSRRDGSALQFWTSHAFFAERLTLSAGLGPCVAVTQNDDLPRSGSRRRANLGAHLGFGQLSTRTKVARAGHLESSRDAFPSRCGYFRSGSRLAFLIGHGGRAPLRFNDYCLRSWEHHRPHFALTAPDSSVVSACALPRDRTMSVRTAANGPYREAF